MLILLDTLRADRLGCYGHTRPTSPHLDALARRGTLFEHAISPAPWTLPAVASLLAGEPPRKVLRAKLARSLVEPLRRAGYRTAAFTEGGFVSRAFDFDRGFEIFEEEEGAVQRLRPGESPRPASGSIERTFARARAWLAAHRDEPFFLLIHTYEPHAPYTNRDFVHDTSPRVGPVFPLSLLPRIRSGALPLRASDLAYIAALYDGDVRRTDEEVGAFLAFLEDLGLSGQVLVVVTSDHGEELGEHYPRHAGDHGHALLDTLVRVPLILFDPELDVPTGVIENQVRLLDVMPTILERLGVSVPPAIEGRSLVPVLEGRESADRPAVLGSLRRGPPRLGVRTRRWKYIEVVARGASRKRMIPPPPERQLYDLVADPGERHNLVEELPEIAEAWHRWLAAWRRGAAAPPPDVLEDLDAQTKARLKSLGYLD